jgi:hypothetical protein
MIRHHRVIQSVRCSEEAERLRLAGLPRLQPKFTRTLQQLFANFQSMTKHALKHKKRAIEILNGARLGGGMASYVSSRRIFLVPLHIANKRLLWTPPKWPLAKTKLEWSKRSERGKHEQMAWKNFPWLVASTLGQALRSLHLRIDVPIPPMLLGNAFL